MKKILLLAFTASVMLGACKKDKSDDPETVPTCAIIKVKEMQNAYTSTVKFDEQGRLKEENGSDFSSQYEYQSDKIIVTDIESYYTPARTYVTTHTLDGQGRIIKSVDDDGTATYEYNNDGYLVKEISSYNGSNTTETYTWESGNLVKIVHTYSYGGSTPESSTSTITYGNDVLKDKLVTGFIFGEIYSRSNLQDYFGKKPKNAPVMEQGNRNGGQTDIYSYVKDTKGNITGFSMTKGDETTPWWDYSVDYNCN